jgi:eukaryotic-like serine/threonine-protein kinase
MSTFVPVSTHDTVDHQIGGNRSTSSFVGWTMGTPTTSLPVRTRLGNYELVRLLAQGGMADIYLAKQLGIGAFERYVAVKVMNASRAADPDSCALFLDEARLLAMLNHHNLASVYEVDREGAIHYLAMEYVHGADLRDVLAHAERAETAIPYETAVAVVMGAASGLDHAHRRCGPDGRPMRLVHRDVSLSNIMVGHDGTVKVVDFGIAIASVSSHHTNPGIVRGKASYMSPEQALGDDVDLRTDVFALGVVLYELTTGRRCFQGSTDFERMLAVVRGDYVPPSAIIPDFPPALERVIETALATDASKRYASAAQLLEALERVAMVEGWNATPATIAALMHELYGEVAEPFGQVATAEVTDSAIVEAQPVSLVAAPQPTVIITRPRRLAHGTESEQLVSEPDRDDEPTRGRRSVPRMFRYAA